MPELNSVMPGERQAADIPVTVVQRSEGPLRLFELWEYRELLYFLIWRDVKVRYKQTLIGAAWAVVQPMLMMAAFTLIFAKIASVPADGLPYPLFSYAGLLPWSYFSKSLTNSITSIVGNAHLITKVYFPRLLLPLSATLSGIIDFGVAFVFLLGLMVWYGIAPSWSALVLLPILVVFTTLTVLSVSLWLSVINVRYRDVGQAIPFLIQLWLFVSPVAYPVSIVPEKWRVLYSLNPMTGIIESFRWTLLGKGTPPMDLLALSMLIVIALLWGGIVFFKRLEQTFADVV